VGKAAFTGHCSRCHAVVTAEVEFASSGAADVAPPPVIGSYCNCGEQPMPGGRDGAQAVPLTLREAV
jgi:hypothetical protein